MGWADAVCSAFCLDARADGIRGGIRGERLVNRDKLLKTVYLNQLIDVFVWIGIRSRVLVLHLGDQQGQKIIR